VTDRTIQNVHRLLRPGGTLYVSDFPTHVPGAPGFNYASFLGAIDSADNCEPFAPAFIRSQLERKLEANGFKLRAPKGKGGSFVRIADKLA
jgi:SAM-dependent methyltransferase